MLVFIDESGDAGFKTKQGSSKFFVLTLVIFDDELEAEKTTKKIFDLKTKWGKPLEYEIKFNKLRESDKIFFLNKVKNCKFRVRAIIIEKDQVCLSRLRKNSKAYYCFFLKQVLEHNRETISNAKLRLDGSGERNLRNALVNYLRKELNQKNRKVVISDLKFVNSKSSLLIQLTDMVTGSIYRSYQYEKKDRKIYKEIIEKRIEEEWIYKG